VASRYIILWCVLAVCCRATAADQIQRPLLVAHYMPWFEAKPASRQWGWHWTMNAFDPEQTTDGKRHIASHYYPLIGPYDSSDPAVIEYHLLLIKLAGIDGVIVDWYGLSDFLDYPILHRNTAALFKSAAKIGLRVGICYEDHTITELVKAKRLAAEDRVTYAKREIRWLRQNWFSDPVYLRLNDSPVLLSFGSEGLSDDEWAEVIRAADGPLLYLSEHRRRSAASGTFDWPQPQIGLASLDRYYQSEPGTQLKVPVAFPQFYDIYQEAKVHESYGRIPDDQGRTLALTLARAWNSGAPLVQIATWNDWGEGTTIEPSQEFGYRELETIQKLRRTGDPRFRATSEDLRLPYRLWVLRERHAIQPQLTSELDAIAHLLASGDVSRARSALKRIETNLVTTH
jgi:hypothetical protein